MWTHVGVVRTDEGLEVGIDLMKDIEKEAEMLYKRKNTRAIASLWNATETGLLIAKAAGGNLKSLGAHYRVAAEDPPRMYSDDEMELAESSDEATMKCKKSVKSGDIKFGKDEISQGMMKGNKATIGMGVRV